MKKINTVLVLIGCFIFSFFVQGSNNNISAKVTNVYTNNEEIGGCVDRVLGNPNANFWEYTCSEYTIENGKYDTSGKYRFSHEEHFNHNYSFDYDYEIKISRNIDALATKYFLGITEPTTISFFDIATPQDRNKPESFVVYKFLMSESEYVLVNQYGQNAQGSHTIDAPGIYRLETLIESGGTEYVTYVVYEPDFYYASLRTIDYDSYDQSLVYKAKVNTPKYISECQGISVWMGGISQSSISACDVEKSEVSGEYEIIVRATNNVGVADNAYTTLRFEGIMAIDVQVSYDSVAPVITKDITYYPEDMIVDEFALQYNDEPLALPKNTVIKFEIEDDSYVQVMINTTQCKVDDGKVECHANPNYGSALYYTLTDIYGNEEVIYHSNISYISIENVDTEYLKSKIEITGNKVEFKALDEYNIFEKICIFYGESKDEYKCANVTSELAVVSDKYYYGDIMVSLVDSNMNVINLSFTDKTLNNGYDSNVYKFENIEGNSTDKLSILTEMLELVDYACAGDEACLETVEIYGKYGDSEEKLSDVYNPTALELPTYLEIINKGFTNKACAFTRCDETIEAYVAYSVGGVKQKLASTYSYVDKLPQINEEIYEYKQELKYDFSELDINSFEVGVDLFATPRSVELKDGYNTKYVGRINTKFIRYIDRAGNVSDIDQPYTYIGGKDDFGYYILEGVITLTRNKTLNQDISEPMYGKSFFIKVELADTKNPVLTLIGSEEMTVKQYDVFKDPEVKCNDASSCTITIKYYYGDENSEVNKVDTSTPGKYTIKYFAVDGDGNTSEISRIVNVESVNAMNATSIIIIVVVVVLFAGSIALAIIIERKRRKEEA